MSMPLSVRQIELRSLISNFLSDRLSGKLEALDDDDPKRAELQAQFVPVAWLSDAARRVSQIQAVTHSLKPIHPDAKGSSLFCEPGALAPLNEVGSHILGQRYDSDVVGNAAALDVYKLLKISHQGRSLLELAMSSDPDLCTALSDDTPQAQAWVAAFASLAEPRGKPASHTNAKQIYWPVGDDLHDDSSYHLLAPLYPTSLIHRVYTTLQDDRFSDAAKAAREARKSAQLHERPVREYPNLAIQKLGGTKPQNISQLNSERRGDNCLLASLPPIWKSLEVKPLHGVDSLFKRFGWRRQVRILAAQLRRFLEGDPANNQETRQHRDDLVNGLIDEVIQFAAEVATLTPGWSTAPECDLAPAHRVWLDPIGTDVTMDDATDRVAGDFANWLNAQLRDPLPLGDPEFLYWRHLAREQFKQDEREADHER